MVYSIYIQNRLKEEYLVIFKRRSDADSAYIAIKDCGDIQHPYDNITFYGILGDLHIKEKNVQSLMRNVRFTDKSEKVQRVVCDDILVINPSKPVVEV